MIARVKFGLLSFSFASLLLCRSALAEEVYLLKDPMAAAAAAWQISMSAKKSQYLDYFIFSEDLAGYTALAAAEAGARAGVPQYIMVDAYPEAPLENLTEPALAYLDHLRTVEKLPIFIKRYNVANMVRPIKSRRFRSHDKLQITDEKYVRTGDKNIGDPYFEVPWKRFHEVFGYEQAEVEAFDGMDVVVEGEGKRSVRDAVDYVTEKWEKKFLTVPALEDVSPDAIELIRKRVHLAGKLMRRFMAQNPQHANSWKSNPIHVDDVRFIHDPLEIKRAMPKQKGKHVAADIYAIPEKARAGDLVKIYTPYLILTPEMETAVKKAIKRGVRLRFYTNTSESTDMEITGIVSPYENKKLIGMGAEVFVYDDSNGKSMHSKTISIIPARKKSKAADSSASSGGSKAAPRAKSQKWIVSIHTMNWDPRSQNKNTEVGFIFNSRQLSNEYHRLMNQSMFRELNEDELEEVTSPWEIFKAGLKETKISCIVKCAVRDVRMTLNPNYVPKGPELPGSCGDLFTVLKAIIFRGDL